MVLRKKAAKSTFRCARLVVHVSYGKAAWLADFGINMDINFLEITSAMYNGHWPFVWIRPVWVRLLFV